MRAAGSTLEAGGTWLGLNDDGVVAAMLNRRGTLGPQPGQAQPRRAGAGGARPCRGLPRGRRPARARPRLPPVQPDRRGRVDAFWLRHAGDGGRGRAGVRRSAHDEAGELDDPIRPDRALPAPVRLRPSPDPRPATGRVESASVDRNPPEPDPQRRHVHLDRAGLRQREQHAARRPTSLRAASLSTCMRTAAGRGAFTSCCPASLTARARHGRQNFAGTRLSPASPTRTPRSMAGRPATFMPMIL